MLFIVICMLSLSMLFFFFLTRSTPVIYTLSLHDALPICGAGRRSPALGALLHLARAGRPHPAASRRRAVRRDLRSEEHTSELQSHSDLVCRLLLEKKKLIRLYL